MKKIIIPVLVAVCGLSMLAGFAEPTTREEGVTRTTPTGLQITDYPNQVGMGAQSGDKVRVHYTGTLLNGEKFDSSVDRGKPLEFVLGSGQMIKGWDEGLVGMNVGQKRTLVIPPALGWGAAGRGPIPPNASVKFEVLLVGVTRE